MKNIHVIQFCYLFDMAITTGLQNTFLNDSYVDLADIYVLLNKAF